MCLHFKVLACGSNACPHVPRCAACGRNRWQAIKPRAGPGGNPALVMAQLEDAAAQLADVQAEVQQLIKVRGVGVGIVCD